MSTGVEQLQRLRKIGGKSIEHPFPQVPMLNQQIRDGVLKKAEAQRFDLEMSEWSKGVQNVLRQIQRFPQFKEWTDRLTQIDGLSSDNASNITILNQLVTDVSNAQNNIGGSQTNILELLNQTLNLRTRMGLVEQPGYYLEAFTSSDQWVVQHNLGKYPIVQVMDTSFVEFKVLVSHDSVNQCTIDMNDAKAGWAICQINQETVSGIVAPGGSGSGSQGFTSPTTTRGDLIARGEEVDERLPIGALDYIVRSNGSDPYWSPEFAPSNMKAKIVSISPTSTDSGNPTYAVIGASYFTVVEVTDPNIGANVYMGLSASGARKGDMLLVQLVESHDWQIEIEEADSMRSRSGGGGSLSLYNSEYPYKTPMFFVFDGTFWREVFSYAFDAV